MKDINDLKIDLIEKILKTRNSELLSELEIILRKETEEDWWNQLPQEVKEAIFEGIRDIENNNVFTDDQIIREAKQKYGF